MSNQEKRTRRFDTQIRALPFTDDSGGMWVEGLAAKYDSPTVLYTEKGIEYAEVIARGAFDDCDMSDVIFNYNHGGKVLARTRNGTLTVEDREEGLFIRARLDGTEEGRRMYDEIQKGYVDRMSFRFDIGEEEESAQPGAHLWTIRRIPKVWDVSAVDIPAYDDTIIAARRAAIASANSNAAAETIIRRKGAVRRKISVLRAKSI